MGLTAALNNATSGLRATQAGIELVSTNVANAGSVGYSRRTLSPVESVAGGQPVGVLAGSPQRVIDTLIQRQLRTETSGASYTAVRAEYYRAIDQLFGQPGGANALDTLFNDFSASLDALLANPASGSARSDVLSKAGTLASQIGDLSRSIQDLRRGAESAIASGVGRANDLLAQIETLNGQITGYPDGDTPASLLDQRDTAINELSKILDVRVTEDRDGGVTLATTGGVLLFDGQRATRLEFEETPNIGPQTVYGASGGNSLGTIRALTGSGGSIDLIATKGLRSGELAAYLELRDQVLVQAQEQLDQFAAGLARAVSDEQRVGAAATSGAAQGFSIDTTGFQTGTLITIDTVAQPSGQTRKLTINADLSGGLAGLATQIGTALGAGYTVSTSGSTLTILDDGAGGTTDVAGLRASVTQNGLTGAVNFPLFTDGSGPASVFTGAGSQVVGFSQRIAVNPQIKTDPSRLVVYNAGVQSGDPARPTALVNSLRDATFAFTTSAPLSGYTAQYNGTVGSFARRIVESQGAAAAAAASLDEGQQVALATVEDRYAAKSGVNIDQELAQLVQLQTAYSANARVITAVKEMMDLLLRI